MTSGEKSPGLTLATGPADAAQEWVGTSGDTHVAHEPVNAAMIRFYASMIEDSSPTYWQRECAERLWGGICSPPGMLTVWRRPLLWRPDSKTTEEEELFAEVPFPAEKDAILTVNVDTKLHRQLLEGEWLTWRDEITDISAEKDTELGRGHFITSETTYRNQRGQTVATNTKTIFRYESAPSRTTDDRSIPGEGRNVIADRAPERARTDDSLRVEQIREGDPVPGYQFPVSYEKVIHDVAATRDFYPGHYDPVFAREQGNDTIFLNNIAFQGLADRLALEWAGPEWRLRTRSIRIQGPAPAGTCLTVDGEITEIRTDDAPAEVDIAGEMRSDEDTAVCSCAVTISKMR